MRKLLAIVSLSLMGATSPAFASGIPTVDVANILQTTISAIEAVEQTANQVIQIQRQIDQYQQQVAQFQSITGNYNMGTLLNSAAYRDARRMVPRTWQETLDMLDGAVAAANQVETQNAARDARAAGRRFAAPDIYPDVTTPDAVEYIRQANQVFTQLGVGQSNYSRTEQRVTNIEDLSGQIDTANDLKAAIDLQNRLIAENGILMAELIRLQSANHINAAEERLDEMNRRAADVAMAEGTIAVIPPLP